MRWIANNKIVYVVVVDNICDICCLLLVSLVFVLVSDRRFILAKFLIFVSSHKLTGSFDSLLVVRRNHLRLLFAWLWLLLRLEVAHFQRLYNWLARFFFFHQITFGLLVTNELTILEQIALACLRDEFRLLSNFDSVLREF